MFNGVDGFVGFGAFGGFDGRDQSEGSGADWTGVAAGNGGWSPLLQIFVQIFVSAPPDICATAAQIIQLSPPANLISHQKITIFYYLTLQN